MKVPTRVTVHLTTANNGDAMVSIGVAEKDAQGNYRGAGTRAITINPATLYAQYSASTGLPTGQTIQGQALLDALYGLFAVAPEV